MVQDKVYTNEVTFVGLIHFITLQNMVQEGPMIHELCIKTSFLLKQVVAKSFITMYTKFEAMKDLRKIFEEREVKDITSWNAIISSNENSDPSNNNTDPTNGNTDSSKIKI